MPPEFMYPQFYDMTRRFFPQFLSLLPPSPPHVSAPVQAPAKNAADSGNIVFVEGDAGAAAYPVQPGENLVLFDSQADRVFVKTVAADGRPKTKVSELHWNDLRAPDDPENRFVSKEDFSQLKDFLMKALADISANLPTVKEAPNNA